MDITDQRILVTGGGGFVGSHIANRLTNENHVTVIDNFSTGNSAWLNDKAVVVEANLADENIAESIIDESFDIIFHLASRKEVNDPDLQRQFRNNTEMTHNLLRAAHDAGVTHVVYTSSSTVYGEAPQPTPEDYAPIEPISVYGASKLADEGLLSTYAHSHGFSVWNFRFANVVGSRLRGAVIPDFIQKLRSDPKTLTILGNGRQEKSYLHIDDCIDGMLHTIEHHLFNQSSGGSMHTYNLGTRTTTSVNRIADIVCDVLGVDPQYTYTGGDRGWTGDVPRMRLSIEKLSALGWEPRMESDDAIRAAAETLANEL
ncbi:NAD-dependent epimerase/dehydratase family protein [Salinadaptatus halalkaliphilus]|uniref:NAD-dependent epimerase/dehydratase family protein n=1 Tax=Salinadaptatus halalkaliphilus TaxID=2419781 RepID=A0A4V3VLF0_9EURY|nr:NAD-dependent epimerase/dehydratase family protein [Salinadaptatus halalkaliphilus]THE65437.1 NAD-dependent epimerase/dehydratase family protein [Salinadaptatus halalkaliphilus]